MEQEEKVISMRIPDDVLEVIKSPERAPESEKKRRKLKPRYRRRFIARMAIFLSLTAMVGGLYAWAHTHKNAIEVYSSGELVGVVNMDKQLTAEILTKTTEERLKEENQSPVAINADITLQPVHAPRNLISETGEMLDKLCAALPYKVQAAAFVLDGQTLAVLKDQAEALTVRDNIFAKFVTHGVEAENSSFVENVLIEDIFVEKSAIITMGKAFEALTAESVNSSVYTVKQNDVLGLIAERNKMTLRELIAANPGITEKSTLSVGQELNVKTAAPVLSVKTVETVAADEVALAPVQQQLNPRAKTARVLQEGQDGKQRVTKRVTRVNGVIQSEEVVNTVILEEPVPQIIETPVQQ